MGSISSRLKEAVREWYARQGIPPDSPQLIALSGGADSMALLYLLRELSRMAGRGGKNLRAAYYDHNLRSREELDREIALIRSRTDAWDIPLYTEQAGRGELESRALEEKRSLEDAAREGRYAFLERTRIKTGCAHIVLAHHGNDQAETMITRFFQGTGPAGLKGILPVAGNRIRPLLAIPKGELIRCLEEKGIGWSEDSTNGDDRILRNKLRASLLPELDRAFPGYETSLRYLSEKMARCDDYFSRAGKELFNREGEARFTLSASDFAAAHPAVREYALYHAIDVLLAGTRLSGGKGRRVPYRFIRPLLDPSPPETLILGGHGLRITIDRDRIELKKEG